MSAQESIRRAARLAFAAGALALSCATASAPNPSDSPAAPAPEHAAAPAEERSVAPAREVDAPAPPADLCAPLPYDSTAKVARLDPSIHEEAPPKLRLPDDVHPSQEALSLNLDPSKARFSGVAAIALELDQPRSVIWLHGRDLHVTEAHLDLQGARLPVEYSQVNEGGLVRVRLPCRISGRALLSIAWDAAFNEHLAGLYIARERGIPYVYSQFESIDARRAFPSFDEPGFKIPWDIELTVRADDVAISNGSIASESSSENSLRRIRFTTTPPLPTYLLAFAVGPFDVVVPPPLPANDARDHELPVRFIAPKGRGEELQFAVEATAALLPRLESWFGIAYPYEKLDQIAVPDFTAGAMENAGAITYRESALLYNKGVSGVRAQSAIAVTMAHEMAHQWFGDLVTLRWWTDLWLNESFASWMEAKVVEEWRPELRAGIEQLAQVHGAMQADATATARAIRKPVEDEASIGNQFDGMTYSKGAGLLAMVENWLGREPMRRGIQNYLRAHANGGGSADDLFAALTEAAAHDVGAPMRTFLEQAGVPMVRAKLVCDGRVHLAVEQSRALPLGAAAPELKAQRWQIPICAHAGVRGEIRTGCLLLTRLKDDVEIPGTRCPDWVMPNAGGLGYYRFTLDTADMTALINARAQLSPAERVSLASNLQSSYSLGTMPAADVLRALAGFARDREPEAGAELMGILEDARESMIEPRLRPALEAYARATYQPIAEKLGWAEVEGEPPSARVQRASVLHFLAFTGLDPAVRAEGARLGRAYANVDQDAFNPDAVAPDLAGLALALAAQEGGPEVRQKLVARLANSSDTSVRRRILGALSDLRDPALTPELLKLTFDPQLHKNERGRVLMGQLMHPETRAPALTWLTAHWEPLAAQVPAETMAFFVRLVAALPCDRGAASAAEAFLRPRAEKIPAGALDLEQGLEASRLCIARRESQGRGLNAFFAALPARH